MHNCDVIVDGPFIQEEHEPGLLFKGSRNQRIINVVESLKQGRIVLMNITKSNMSVYLSIAFVILSAKA